jgi:hypothetical protein
MDEKVLSKHRTLVKYFVISLFLISLTLILGLAGNHAQALCTRVDSRTGTALPDTDCDGLADSWETQVSSGGGYDANGDRTIDLDLYSLGARPNHKDIFLEIDYLGHHVPWPTIRTDLQSRFLNAPVWNPTGGGTGINLVIYFDDNIPNPGDACTHIWTTPTPSFDSLKNQYLGTVSDRFLATPPGTPNPNYPNIKTAKMNTFHYGLFIHTQCENPPSSGIGEVFGNDFVVSLGYPGWGQDNSVPPNVIGSVSQQESVVMHELGHNLNLLHGGNANTNCKPNYLSIMNYMFEFPDVVSGRPLDYSRSTLYTLIENSLSEPVGIKTSTPPNLRSAFGPSPAWITDPLSNLVSPYYNPVNWDRTDGNTATGVTANINNIGRTDCNYAASSETLYGFTDWSNLAFWGTGGGYSNSTGPLPAMIEKGKPNLSAISNDTSAILNDTSSISNDTSVISVNQTTLLNNVANSSRPFINSIPPCDIQDPECTPAKIGLCDADEPKCISTPCDINDSNCLVPPCDPRTDDSCLTNRERAQPEITIDDVRGQRVSEVSHINNMIQSLSDGNFVGPELPNQIKSIFRDKLIASRDSALVSVATDKLDNAILKLNEVRTEITSRIQPADTRDVLNALINNLSEALQLQR